MKAIILAAGRGSRMKSLTKWNPKCLIKYKGKALLDWQIQAVRQAGIEEIGIVTGYMGELLEGYGLTRFHNERWAETNMVSSLSCANEWLENEACVVSYSDIFYQATAVEALMESKASLAITYDPNWLTLWSKRFEDPLMDAETFIIDSDNLVREIGSAPKTVDEVQGQFMGLLRISPIAWHEINKVLTKVPPSDRDAMQTTNLLSLLIKSNRQAVHGIKYAGSWGEVDSEDDLNTYM